MRRTNRTRPTRCSERLKAHRPYTKAAWRADSERKARGELLTCPDCGFSGDYRIYGPREDERAPYQCYRACKACGFWQDTADAYRCWKSTHTCDPKLNPPYKCEHCDRAGLTGPHDCGKYLKSWEDGYACETCGQWQGRETVTAWDLPGSD